MEVFPVPDVNSIRVLSRMYSLQGFPMGTAAMLRRLFDREHRHAQVCHHIDRALVSMAMIMPGIVAGHVFRGAKDFHFHLPAGPARTHHSHHPFLLEGKAGCPGPSPASAIGTGPGAVEEGDPRVDVRPVQGNIRVPPGVVCHDPSCGPFGPGVGPDIRMAGDPVGREPVVSRLHARDETDAVVPEVPDVGTVGGWGIPGDEPPGGVAPTIVPAGSVLPGDRLRCRGNDNVGVGMDGGAPPIIRCWQVLVPFRWFLI